MMDIRNPDMVLIREFNQAGAQQRGLAEIKGTDELMN
jgi:hypothetical protein